MVETVCHKAKRVSGLLIMAGLALALTLDLAACATNEKHVRKEIVRLYTVQDPQFAETMGVLLGPAIIGGNRFEALDNGDEIFPAMLKAIAGAQNTIDFETYIYWSGEIGRKFADALTERAQAGIKVHVMLDWLGSNKLDNAVIEGMAKSGVIVKKYHPLIWYNWQRLNNRTHRKLLIVDGRIGFTGGVGIADLWNGQAQDPDHWRDSHYRAEGPVVSQMQAVFMDNWIKVTGQVLHGPEYFPVVQPLGDSRAQMFSSSPSGGSESMKLMYLLAITAAAKSIHLSSAYFVPDALTRDALVDAVKRGVKVQIITPGKYNDQETVRRASRARWGDLLQAGVEIYEYQPTMYHCKIMIVDDLFVSVGSTNFDPRSFGLNDEANLNIYDHAFAAKRVEVFEDDLAHAKRMTYEYWRHRPLQERLIEHAASLLGPQL
ncbi:MAG: phospholipase D-like domain-containing protein [Nevskia sp.]